MFVGLAVVIALGSLFVVACGDDESAGPDPKVAMQQALDKVEAAVATLIESVPTANGADMKQILVDYEADWQALVAAAENLEGADAAEAQKKWDDIVAAIETLDDDSVGTELLGAVTAPGLALQSYVASLRELVGPSATTGDTTE